MNYSEAGYMVKALHQFFLQSSLFIKVDNEIKLLDNVTKQKVNMLVCVYNF